jgi:hypothetical protein
MNEITLLYFDGCPSWKPALDNLKRAIEAEQIPVEITLYKIDTPDQAQRVRFLGSPSFQVDGIDLWPEERKNYVISCRVYQTPGGLKGIPTIEMLRQRMREKFSSLI